MVLVCWKQPDGGFVHFRSNGLDTSIAAVHATLAIFGNTFRIEAPLDMQIQQAKYFWCLAF
jgi:hypothetical protein